jgi:hypothetical protein
MGEIAALSVSGGLPRNDDYTEIELLKQKKSPGLLTRGSFLFIKAGLRGNLIFVY